LFYNWDKPTNTTTANTHSFYKLLKQCTKTVDKAEKLLNKINSSQTLVISRLKSIPQNATIMSEYIKCGKDGCLHEIHGPYYYAYWKDPDSEQLKKKYIGNRMPENKEAKNNCNHNQIDSVLPQNDIISNREIAKISSRSCL
jgi:hypothetical protein